MYVSGSTAIVVISPDVIAIAADSKVVMINNGINHHAGETCKITKLGHCFLVNTGLLSDTAGKFDVVRAASTAYDEHKSIAEIAAETERIICKELADVAPDLIQEGVDSSKYTVEIALCGFELQQPHLIVKRINLRNIEGIFTPIVADIAIHGNLGMISLGHHSEIDKYLSEFPSPLRDGWVDGFTRLISLEIVKNPESVGLPIDVLLIEQNGARWLQKPQEHSHIALQIIYPGYHIAKRRKSG